MIIERLFTGKYAVRDAPPGIYREELPLPKEFSYISRHAAEIGEKIIYQILS